MSRLLFFLGWCLFLCQDTWAQADPVQTTGLYSFGNDFADRSYSVTVDDSGNTVLAGTASSASVNFDLHGGYSPGEHPVPGCYLVRYRADGSLHWARYAGYPDSQFLITHLKTDHANNTLVLGWYRGLIDIDFSQTGTEYLRLAPNRPSLFLAKLDSNGTPLQHTEWIVLSDSFDTYIGDRSFISDCSIDPNGNIYLAGYSGNTFVNEQLVGDTLREFNWFVMKLDSALQLRWMNGLEKTVHEFHNWTNFYPVMADADRDGRVYVTLCYGDSINLRFRHESPQYVAALPFDYPNPPSQESANRDLLIIQYDAHGNYRRHRSFHTDRVSSEKNLDADVLPNGHLYVLAAYDREFSVGDSTWRPVGVDSLYDYNLILLELDERLEVVRHARFHNNILSPRGWHNYLEPDECGNLLVRIDQVMYNGFPFPPFEDNSVPVLYRENSYVFNEALELTDTLAFPDFHLYDFFSSSLRNGHLRATGAFAGDFNMDGRQVSERNPNPPNSYYDIFLLHADYPACKLPPPEPLPDIIVPNVFTPDKDGSNDTWQIRDSTLTWTGSWKVFNRWGQTIASGVFPGSGWDGKDARGNPCPGGVYYYLLRASGNGVDDKSGWIQLIR